MLGVKADLHALTSARDQASGLLVVPLAARVRDVVAFPSGRVGALEAVEVTPEHSATACGAAQPRVDAACPFAKQVPRPCDGCLYARAADALVGVDTDPVAVRDDPLERDVALGIENGL